MPPEHCGTAESVSGMEPIPDKHGLTRFYCGGNVACHQKRGRRPPCVSSELIQLGALMYIACLTDREGKTKHLTLDDYKALRFEEYTWVLDGLAEPPICHRDGSHLKLRPAEFRALAKVVRSRGAALAPRSSLFEGLSSSNESAIRRFEKAREKVEPGQHRGGGAFRTVGDKEDRRYSFQPDPELKYCLVERLDPPVQLDSQGGVATGSPARWSLPDFSVLHSILALPASAEQLKPIGPVHKLIPKPAPPVEGITVLVHRLSLVGRHARARVTVSNATYEPKFVGYFTLHVGENSSRAVRYRPGSRRRGAFSRARAYLEPEMLVVRARRAVVGFLFFRTPRLGGDTEASIRPHVVRTQVVD